MQCQRCGNPIQPDWVSCPSCGLQFAQQAPAPQFQQPMPPAKMPAIQNTAVIILALLFCFPLGAIFAWINPKWKLAPKILVTVVPIALCIILGIIGNSPAAQKQAAIDAQNAKVQQAQQDKQDAAQAKQDAAAQKQQSASDAQAAKQQQDALLHVSVDQLATAYAANEIAANKKYDNVEMIVSGKVDGIDTAIAGQSYVTLTGGTAADGFTTNQVTCYFSDDQSDALAKLNKGDKIKIHGTGGGAPISLVVVNDCTLAN